MYNYHLASVPQGPGMVGTREDGARSHLEPASTARTAGVTRGNRYEEEREQGVFHRHGMQRSAEEERQP